MGRIRLHAITAWIAKQRAWQLAIFYALLLAGASAALPRLLEWSVFQVFTVEQDLTSDFHLNDLYYQFGSAKQPKRVHDVVILNTQPIGEGVTASFRSTLAELIETTSALGPSAIGIDLIFGQPEEPSQPFELATSMLRYQLAKNPEIIIGVVDGQPGAFLPDSNRWGVVNFPEQGRVSIRSYNRFFGALPSFAARMVTAHRPGFLEESEVPDAFPLHYLAHDQIIHPVIRRDSVPVKFEATAGIPVVDARDLLMHPKLYEEWIVGKMVIIGNVSSSPFDIEDKHRIPSDPVLFHRLPLLSGPLIHAIAIENMMHFEDLGWRTVPKWVRNTSSFLLLVLLIYLVLFTPSGHVVNFGLLGLTSIPVLLCGFLLMRWGWYWPMTSTLLPFVFIEEIMEVIDPFCRRIWRQIQQLKNLLLPLILLLAASTMQAQSIDILVIQGQVASPHHLHTPDRLALFTIYPGDSILLADGAQALVTDTQAGNSTLFEQPGTHDYGSLMGLFSDSSPSLTSEFIRVVFIEPLQPASSTPNIGAAIRGDQPVTVLPLDGTVIWTDSVWIGMPMNEPFPPEIDWSLSHPDGRLWAEGVSATGGTWVGVAPGATYHFEIRAYEKALKTGQIRVASPEEHHRCAVWTQALLNACTDCPANIESTLRGALQRRMDE